MHFPAFPVVLCTDVVQQVVKCCQQTLRRSSTKSTLSPVVHSSSEMSSSCVQPSESEWTSRNNDKKKTNKQKQTQATILQWGRIDVFFWSFSPKWENQIVIQSSPKWGEGLFLTRQTKNCCGQLNFPLRMYLALIQPGSQLHWDYDSAT